MHPDGIEGYAEATEGEKGVSRFIKDATRPHEDFTYGYQHSNWQVGERA